MVPQGRGQIFNPLNLRWHGLALSCGWIASICLLGGCKEETSPTPPLARVHAATVQLTDFAPEITLTGVVIARVQSDVSFRLSGKIRERLVNVGDHVTADQVLARLDPAEQEADVESAMAGVQSAQAVLRQAATAFERSRNLLAAGNVTRRDYDQAEASHRMAQAQLEQAQSQLASAREQLAFTELRAGADGIIVDRTAEAGQVVAQAQPVYTLARDGALDAVFNVHEWALANVDLARGIAVSLVADPKVGTTGEVRLVSPAVDAKTMTVAVRLGLRAAPPAMVLGALVNGTGLMKQHKVFLVPWAAVFEMAGKPAIWVIDPQSSTVSLKPVAIDRYNRDSIAVTGGIEAGQTIVTAGGQSLRPGQKVEIAAERKP